MAQITNVVQEADELLEQEIKEQRNLLRADRMDISFGEIISMYERGELIIRPAFQRLFRWEDEQKTRFIESIILGIPIPPIFVAENSDTVWELVDGLQRVSTVLSFFGILKSEDEGMRNKNSWELEEGERLERLEGRTAKTLPMKFQLLIKRATCRVEIIRWDSKYDMRFELFNRLNTGGSLLTSQEIRNCLYRDENGSKSFYDFLEKLSQNENFIKIVGFKEQDLEQQFDQELVLRFISLYKATKIHTSISQHMTSFMEKTIKQENANSFYKEYEDIFAKVTKILSPLGNKIFKQKDGKFATALYDTIMIGVAEYVDKYENIGVQQLSKKLEQVRRDETLLKFSRKGGNNQRTRILNRLKEARRIFSKYE